MSKLKDVRMETDINGVHKVMEYDNGICVKILKEPSKEYIKKRKKQAEESAKKQAEKQIERNREKLIQDRMRENAIKELEKEGKI